MRLGAAECPAGPAEWQEWARCEASARQDGEPLQVASELGKD